jgi:hypothetical protein
MNDFIPTALFAECVNRKREPLIRVRKVAIISLIRGHGHLQAAVTRLKGVNKALYDLRDAPGVWVVERGFFLQRGFIDILLWIDLIVVHLRLIR